MKRLWALEIRLEDELTEARADFRWVGRTGREDLRRLLRAIRSAREDPRVGAMVLSLGGPRIGWSKLASLARAVREFRSSGKPTLAYLEGASNADYFLACSCESIVMAPASTLHIEGLRAEVFFLKDLLESVGIEAQLESVGEYKSASEMFLRRQMSSFSREQIEELLREISSQMVEAVANGRSLERQHVRELIDEGPHLAEEAGARGLIDRVAHEDECHAWLEERLGTRLSFIRAARYGRRDGLLRRLWTIRRPRIAVLYALGPIEPMDRGSRRPLRHMVGARQLGELFEKIRRSRRVKAVVLRIDCPGGSAMASERLWRAVKRTNEVKPVVVSMGDVAASGGYYIATGASAIVAEPSTLTGSIGIVGGKFVVRRLLDWLGIHRETVAVSTGSGFSSPLRGFSETERRKLQAHLRHFYEELFIPRVAQGRGLTPEQVERVAKGRIWSGGRAKEVGLVDVLGDLETAVELAKSKAGLAPERKVRVVHYVRRPRLRDLLPLGRPQTGAMLGFTPLECSTPLDDVLDRLRLLAAEDTLCLLPWSLMIR